MTPPPEQQTSEQQAREQLAAMQPLAEDLPAERPRRVVIDAVFPEIDAGRYRAKCTTGERFEVTAYIYAEGHDLLTGRLLHRAAGETDWHESPLEELGNDEWRGSFTPEGLGVHEYTIEAWVDRFRTWRDDLRRRVDAGWDVRSELREGADLVYEAAGRAEGDERIALMTAATWLADEGTSQERSVEVAMEPSLAATMERYRDRSRDVRYERVLELWVDRERARYGSWYEMFPRSETPDPSRGATFREAAARLPGIAAMGFDVLYLPPIHPIGTTERKGPNNRLGAEPGDPGSPWAIGSHEGGHTAVHPDLGTIEDFDWFVAEASRHGLEIALDLAYQCSPDHPWVREHPQWFRQRPDGTIKFAENPPKQYQDIYPLDFETEDWQALWHALRDVVLFWIDHGVHIFRVDNPHTKPFPFWRWLIETVQERYPDVIFLSEAFTRPKRLQGLAKLGFTQSYTYFTWRNTKAELIDYFTELTTPPVRDYLRPNLFVNTPDILHEYLQHGGPPAFRVRLALAATLGPSYGIYSGYELYEATPREPGSEEYLDSEKYQVRPRNWEEPGNLAGEIARYNALRREFPALQHNHELWFLPIANDQLIAYMKSDPGGGARVLTVVNLDVRSTQAGTVGVPLAALGLPHDVPFTVRELLSDRHYTWGGEWNYVSLDPYDQPAQLFVFEAATEATGEGMGIRP